MNTDKTKLIAPWLLVIGGVMILQYHAFQFWDSHSEIGWAWSVFFEVAGLWLWYQVDFASRFLGAMASIIVVAAPLYWLTSNAWQDVEAATVAKKSVPQIEMLLRDSIKKYDATIVDYRANSRKPKTYGWAKRIEEVQVRRDADKSALIALLATSAHDAHKNAQPVKQSVHNVTSLVITVLLQCIGLVVVQLTNIKAILFLSCAAHAQPDLQQNAQHVTTNNTTINMLTVEAHDKIIELQQRCQKHLIDNRITSMNFAESCSIKRQDVSFLLNYTPGGRKPSKAALHVLEGVLI